MADPQLELATTFAEVARALLVGTTLDETLDEICRLVVTTVDGCEMAGISLRETGRVESKSSTDAIVARLDALQCETQEGPGVDAIRVHEIFVTGALSTEDRWSHFARRAHDETGVESVLALRLFIADDTLGALNLYSTTRNAFDDHDIAVGTIFATHAAVAMRSARARRDLESKAIARDSIGMAKGMVAAREGVSPDEAFAILSRASQRLNVKLRDVAVRVVEGSPSGPL